MKIYLVNKILINLFLDFQINNYFLKKKSITNVLRLFLFLINCVVKGIFNRFNLGNYRLKL